MRYFAGLAVALIGAACGMDNGMDMAELEANHDALAARELGHYDACMTATQRASMDAETAAYHEDMSALSADMMTTCQGMMDGGGMMSMSCCGTGQMGDASTTMRDEVAAHHTRMDAMLEVNEMHGECTAHHDAMGDMLDEMQAMMAGM